MGLVSDYFVMRDSTMETRALRVSVLHSNASPSCLSHIVIDELFNI
jgi:hypothetical protein